MRRRIQLSIAMGDYDINRPIIDGQVQPQGVELVPLTMPSPERHWRMLVRREFDICELSLGSYAAMISHGGDSLVAIPVFPHRRFRHSYVFVSGARNITRAEQLRGERVGVRSWQTTMGIYMRGVLADHYGLPLDSVTWVAQDAEDVALDLPPDLRLEKMSQGQTLTESCASGQLAGLIYPEIPAPVRAGTGEIRRLFPDARQVEEDYFRQTKIFPIMHLVVIKREIAERHEWLPRNLVIAFEEAKRLARERLNDPRTVSLAWLRWLIEHERELLGADPWEFGTSRRNLHVLETFLRYAWEQRVTSRPLSVDQLFADGIAEVPPSYV